MKKSFRHIIYFSWYYKKDHQWNSMKKVQVYIIIYKEQAFSESSNFINFSLTSKATYQHTHTHTHTLVLPVPEGLKLTPALGRVPKSLAAS